MKGLSLLESIKSSTTTILIYTFKMYLCVISTRVIRNFVKNDGICCGFLSSKSNILLCYVPKRGQWHHLGENSTPGGILQPQPGQPGQPKTPQLEAEVKVERHSDSNLPYFTFEPQQFQPK